MSMSAVHLVTVLCLGIPFQMGVASGAECRTTVNGTTWEFRAGIDEEFSGVPNIEACLDLCNENRECQGYTWASTGVINYCYNFKDLAGYHSCEGCFSGTVPACNTYACSGSGDDILDQVPAQSVQECAQFCHKTLECTAFTYYISASICFLYSQCKNKVPCNDCSTCTNNCISPPVQCVDYMVLDEPDRSVSNDGCGGNGECYCDQEGSSYMSRDWQGPGYYRIQSLGPITQLPESSPGGFHCGALMSGWLRGEHSSEVFVEKNMTVCFDLGEFGDGSGCDETAEITVTNCYGYYVYMLPDTPSSIYTFTKRYCAS